MNHNVLSVSDAIALGDLLDAIGSKKKITWLPCDGFTPVTGELRSLVRGPENYAMLPYGTDVRDAWVWITANGFERTESVRRLINLAQEGGCIYE